MTTGRRAASAAGRHWQARARRGPSAGSQPVTWHKLGPRVDGALDGTVVASQDAEFATDRGDRDRTVRSATGYGDLYAEPSRLCSGVSRIARASAPRGTQR